MASWQWGVGSSSGLIRSWKGVSAAEGSVPLGPQLPFCGITSTWAAQTSAPSA